MCYNFECKEECSSMKEKYCIFRINKQQYELKKRLNSVCKDCGGRLVKAKYKGRYIKLCTNCGKGLERKFRRLEKAI